MIFLPESFDFVATTTGEILELAEAIDGPLITNYKNLAKRYNVWLSLGGFHEREPGGDIRNTHLIIDNKGAIVASYHKIHMFDVNIPGKLCSQESKYIKPGSEIVPPVETPVGRIGLAISYDLRFPELGILYAQMGAQILTYPSAFAFETGSMHWEVLLRSRAIETQSYIIAAAQCGKHNEKRKSWGHAMVVDPRGNIMAQCSSTTCNIIAKINLQLVNDTRLRMPVLNHRRNDLYPEITALKEIEDGSVLKTDRLIEGPDYFTFGQVTVTKKAIFYKTDKTMAFTNKRCVVPGHVLVAPLRVVERLSDMTESEISDMFIVVKHVQNIVEGFYGAKSSTISLQDGPGAGQTIQHVHVHIIPRKPGDVLQYDQKYFEQQKLNEDIADKPRTEEEMATEAEALKKYGENVLKI